MFNIKICLTDNKSCFNIPIMAKDIDYDNFIADYDSELPKLMEKWLEYFDINPRKASTRIHRHPNTIYNWLNGKCYPTSADIATISETFSLDPRFFFPSCLLNINDADINTAKIKEEGAKELLEKLNLNLYDFDSENKKKLFSIIKDSDEDFVEKLLSVAKAFKG